MTQDEAADGEGVRAADGEGVRARDNDKGEGTLDPERRRFVAKDG